MIGCGFMSSFMSVVIVFLNSASDAAVTLGMVLLHEAATSDLDIGKRKSMLSSACALYERLRDQNGFDCNLVSLQSCV